MSKRYVHLLPNEETKRGGMRGWETVHEILYTTYKWDPSVSSARSLRARAITLQESGGHADIVTVGDKKGRVEPIFGASAPGGRPKGMSTPGDGDFVAAPICATACGLVREQYTCSLCSCAEFRYTHAKAGVVYW